MPLNWKLVGLAGIATVVASGAIANRRRREWSDLTAEELRETLHDRLKTAGS